MEHEIFDISFYRGGKKYSGWVNPTAERDGRGKPVSFHVVLDGVSFGYLSLIECKWKVNEDRPAALVEAVGHEIERHYQL